MFFLAIFIRRNNFCDFLFASLDNNTPWGWGLSGGGEHMLFFKNDPN